MGYRSLKSVFHEKGQKAALEEWQQRFHAPDILHWDFQVGEYPIFVVLTQEILESCAILFTQEEYLQLQWQSLEEIAQGTLRRDLILAEARATNAIEGIKHSPGVLEQTLAGIPQGESRPAGAPSAGLLLAYFQLGKTQLPSSPAEVRALYDTAIAGDLDPHDLPDGQLFRKDPVHIFDDQGREEHRGFHPEDKIHAGVSTLLAMLNQGCEYSLIPHLVGHFLLEYIHPFYDGNGRLGRLLLAQGISQVLSVPTALCLSSAIHQSKGKYYRAFKELQDVRSMGDATLWVRTFLGFLHRAQQIHTVRLAEQSR